MAVGRENWVGEDPWEDDLELAGLWSFEAGPHVVLGLDGGATSTICVALCAELDLEQSDDFRLNRQAGRVLGRGVSGSSNHNSVGDASARRALEEAMAAALKAGKVPRAAVRAVCLGMAGVDRPADVDKVTSWMREVFAHEPEVRIHNDAVVALASGTGRELRGAVLIAGTGTIAFGVGADGRQARASGAGPVLGDRGSGYAIATEALGAVMRARDGRGPPTALQPAILRHLGLSSAEDLIGWAYRDSQWGRVAALVPTVKSCAGAGDAEAQRILREAVAELALSVQAVAATLQLAGPGGDEPFPVVLVGGVLEDGGSWDVGAALGEQLARVTPMARPVKPQVEPAVGAAWLVQKAHGQSCKAQSL